MQLKLTNLADLISKVGYIAAVLIFLAQLSAASWSAKCFGRAHGGDVGQEGLRVFGELLGYFVTMVIIIVVAVPEGLPMSVTVSLALAMQKMTHEKALVRQLVACETIGSATVICSDKTGTLTQNKMQIDRLCFDGQSLDRSTPSWVQPDPHPAWPPTASRWTGLALIGGVNSTANLEEKEGKTVTVGNSTEGALLQWLREAGIEYGKLRLQFEPIYQIHFSSERSTMTW